MKPLRIENKIARQLWLESQGLSVSPKGTLDLLGMIKKLGFVQLDSIQVVSRAPTPSLFTHQFQAKPCSCPRGVASIIERIDLGCAGNLMLAIISLTAPTK